MLALCLIVAACGPAPGSPSPSVTGTPLASVTPSVGALACDPTPPTQGAPMAPAPWWRDRVFYEVFVRSFADSDGDGIGDLRGLTDRLDYLNDGDPATSD